MNKWCNKDWHVSNARKFYNIPVWSEGYFDVNQYGHMTARVSSDEEIDLCDVSRELRARGISMPVLIRFPQILHARVDELCAAFDQVIDEANCDTTHTLFYPIKVNQQRTVVENILAANTKSIGLEVGSKTELLAAIGLLEKQQARLICNGYKDRSYIRIALYAQQMGIQVFIVLENLSELDLIEQESVHAGITPNLGVRVRLNTIAAGTWQNTGGCHAKFGLSIHDLLQLIRLVKKKGCSDWLRMLHFHMGSQISNLEDFSRGLQEAMRIFAELHTSQINIDTIDVGGGLAIDYAAQQDSSYFSRSYAIADYARTVIHTIATFCEQNELPLPQIFTENGRAVTAHHAVLITNVVEVDRKFNKFCEIEELGQWSEKLVEAAHHIEDTLKQNRNVTAEMLDEFQDLVDQNFVGGKIDLQERARAECFLQACFARLYPTHGAEIGQRLFSVNKYYCNFSIFQSLPDIWGLQQIFPIVPLTRLHEAPTEVARLHDLTCDSDGQVSRYTTDGSSVDTLLLHPVGRGEEYELGFFLVGAYQEVLGDIHNLFGDTHTVNIEYGENGELLFTELEYGDCVNELLSAVHIDSNQIIQRCTLRLEEQKVSNEVTNSILEDIKDALFGYTYLDSIDRVTHRIKGQDHA